MKFSEIISDVTVTKMFHLIYGHMTPTQEIEINRIQYDSRNITHGDLFIAIRGTTSDGHKFIEDAVERGAICIVLENDTLLPDSYFLHKGVMKVVVPNSRLALAQIASNYYHNPSSKLKIIGITGTNGKTTSAHLIKSILEATGKKTGLIGTIDYRIGDEVFPATHTTPESLELHALLDKMVKGNCEYAVMEVSSHALHQNRVHGIDFSVAVFTNLTQDHLDYHKSMDEYFKSKVILFDNLSSSSHAILNADNEWGMKIISRTNASVLTYGISGDAAVRASNIRMNMEGSRFTIIDNEKKIDIETKLIGKFNLSNILAAYAACRAIGVPASDIQGAIKNISPVRGRFEQYISQTGWTAIIDYAHTHDALENVLSTIHDLFETNRSNKIITVFGCGGDRDRGKRVKMAEVATRLSDITIITSDNPRNEDPKKIIDEIMKGVHPEAQVYRHTDRATAIKEAIGFAKKNDVILIAGKGHEEYQIIGNNKIPFSDKAVVDSFMNLQV
ncbi:MAG: UDP-N-acetylmuramoyl-L-alanyl-D-glutamate--2,6-diaminopimelate ligase [Ignavibacteriales bacterium]|nr:UDP-N-acetylmuramoyl-L-alanyl-D-glutamate--2,6-diaminopimelate ligase [Ignavibacteriales bacterium]